MSSSRYHWTKEYDELVQKLLKKHGTSVKSKQNIASEFNAKRGTQISAYAVISRLSRLKSRE